MTDKEFAEKEAPRVGEIIDLLNARSVELPDPQSEQALSTIDEMKEFLSSLTSRQLLVFANLCSLVEIGVI